MICNFKSKRRPAPHSFHVDCAQPNIGQFPDMARCLTWVCAVEAFSSGCQPHSATAPAGSDRSSHGGNEVAGRTTSKQASSAKRVGTRQLHSDAVAPAVAVQAQNLAAQGRDLSALASLRVLRDCTPEQAWARRAVGEDVKSCPRASRARPVRRARCGN